MKESIVLPPDARESGIKVRPPQGCEIDEVKVVDGFLTVTFKEEKPKLPHSWEEFCDMFPIKQGECFINAASEMYYYRVEKIRSVTADRNIFPDRATAGAVLALMQLIQLRNAYNGDWVPAWENGRETKFMIIIYEGEIDVDCANNLPSSFLYFKSEELRDEFLCNFRPLIEKLKPLYRIKEGGQND